MRGIDRNLLRLGMRNMGIKNECELARGTQKKDKRARRSDAAIRKAFYELLVERDYDKITVTELARRADIDRKTFYLHYASIDDLSDALMHEEVTQLADRVRESITKTDDVIDIHRLYVTIGIETIEMIGERAGVLKYAQLEGVLTRLKPVVVETIISEDMLGLSKVLGENWRMVASSFVAGIFELYLQWYEGNSELELEELAKIAVAIVTGGVAALTKGAK